MSTTDAQVTFGGEFAELKKQLSSMEGEIKKTGDTIKKIGVAAFATWGASLAVGAIGAGLGAIKGQLDSWLNSAKEAELTDARLAIAVRNAGKGFTLTAADISEMASALQDLSTQNDEAIKQAATSLVRYNLTGKTFRETTAAAVAMADALGQDVTESAQTLGRAMAYPERATKMLQRAGLALTDQQKDHIATLIKSGEREKARAAILEAVSAKFAGAASTIVGTWHGMTMQITNMLDDIGEELGGSFVEVFKKMREPVKILLMHIKELAAGVHEWIASFMEAEGVTSAMDTVKDTLFKLFSYVETWVARMPANMKVLWLDIQDNLAEIKKEVGVMLAALPKLIFGSEVQKSGAALYDSGIATQVRVRQEQPRAKRDLESRGTFEEERVRRLEDIKNTEKRAAEKRAAFDKRMAEKDAKETRDRQAAEETRRDKAHTQWVQDRAKIEPGMTSIPGGGGDMASSMMGMSGIMAGVNAQLAAQIANFKKPEKAFSAQFLDAESMFKKQQSGAASVPEKTLTALQNLLLKAQEDAKKRDEEMGIWKDIRDKVGGPAKAT